MTGLACFHTSLIANMKTTNEDVCHCSNIVSEIKPLSKQYIGTFCLLANFCVQWLHCFLKYSYFRWKALSILGQDWITLTGEETSLKILQQFCVVPFNRGKGMIVTGLYFTALSFRVSVVLLTGEGIWQRKMAAFRKYHMEQPVLLLNQEWACS